MHGSRGDPKLQHRELGDPHERWLRWAGMHCRSVWREYSRGVHQQTRREKMPESQLLSSFQLLGRSSTELSAIYMGKELANGSGAPNFSQSKAAYFQPGCSQRQLHRYQYSQLEFARSLKRFFHKDRRSSSQMDIEHRSHRLPASIKHLLMNLLILSILRLTLMPNTEMRQWQRHRFWTL
jgi:hypothetical protein